jgi:hypothetical protein
VNGDTAMKARDLIAGVGLARRSQERRRREQRGRERESERMSATPQQCRHTVETLNQQSLHWPPLQIVEAKVQSSHRERRMMAGCRTGSRTSHL